jgi:hypothetical protein
MPAAVAGEMIRLAAASGMPGEIRLIEVELDQRVREDVDRLVAAATGRHPSAHKRGRHHVRYVIDQDP